MCMHRCLTSGTLAILWLAPLHAAELHVAVTGNDANQGAKSAPLRTIQRAADLAQPGDVVTVHAGVYRERVNPPRGGASEAKRIVYQAAPGAKVEIKGSEVVKGWAKAGNDTWEVALPNSFFGDFNPYRDVIRGEWYHQSGFARHSGTVYLNGAWLNEAAKFEEVLKPVGKAPLWFGRVDATNTTLWAQFPGVDPNEKDVEINVRQAVFYPDQPGRNYITVRGFVMCNAATPWAGAMSEQVGLIGTHWSKGWILEDNEISYSMCVGVTLGRYKLQGVAMPPDTAEGYIESIRLALADGWSKENIGGHVIRNNRISHCEKAGIHGSLGGIFSTITGNTIHDICTRGWIGGFGEASGWIGWRRALGSPGICCMTTNGIFSWKSTMGRSWWTTMCFFPAADCWNPAEEAPMPTIFSAARSGCGRN
ncbi:MAG: right-handed parallel beta-helix repeat-containing protein [Kiritimatiellaeota bacterium]|nr:right-handed parallel beta-helix repeat-containing protein [Kiritimatiellota bacterium]